jgi:adsorption protein B
MLEIDAWIRSADPAARSLLIVLAVWILISGIDDVFLDLVCFFTWLSRKTLYNLEDFTAEQEAARRTPAKRIAVFVPCWKEDGILHQMVTNNVARIRYSTYDFFLGVYPNDAATQAIAAQLSSRLANVHVAVCQNDGPTSKADCLNWIYHRMLAFETQQQCRFDAVVTHDAEDVIHPDALSWINYHLDVYDMVQLPVLPLATGLGEWTHGIYCDEFAEFQTKDMPGRQILGGFIPSNGVGTGFSRWAMERLAGRQGRLFEPECLTEDYENGLRLHYLGCPQLFVPVHLENGEPLATREYFPRTRYAAVKQRTRWVTGIMLQSWERHGWRGGMGAKYWLWRDRKGLVGNPVSMLTSVMLLYGAITLLNSYWTGAPWGFGELSASPTVLWLLGLTTTLQLIHLCVRAWCSARIYGWFFALGSPLRALYANYINCHATLGAIRRYWIARWKKEPLMWLKTEHTYPVSLSPAPEIRRLGEILVSDGRISSAQLQWALATQPPGIRLGEHLMRSGMLSEVHLYQALSFQARLTLGSLNPKRVRRNVARSLPVHLVDEWKIMPYQVAAGFLFLATPEIPRAELDRHLARHTRLQLRLQLVTASNFEALRRELL